MAFVRLPSLPLPEPLRAAEIPSFTNYSVVVRLPDIARRTLAENDFSPETVRCIQALIDEIPNGKVRLVNGLSGEIAAGWAEWMAPYIGMNWLEIPWFFAEEYFYLRILEATGYFGCGDGHQRDPYAHQKSLGLKSTRASLQPLAAQIEHALQQPGDSFQEGFGRLLLADLWGNQNDLSMWPVQQSGRGSKLTGGTASHAALVSGDGVSPSDKMEAARKHVLSDDLDAVLAYFDRLDPEHTRVDLLLDNAGYELVTDLALADFLLASGRAAQVVLHAKCYPVFVSDALEKDILDTLDFLSFEGHAETRAMAVRLRTGLLADRLVIRCHPFWTSPLPAWEMPVDLQRELAGSALLIAKGDANYRRLLGDRHWAQDLPFSSVVDYFSCGILALRTLKSEIAVGVRAERVPTGDVDWMINGRWGLVQFAAPGQ